MTEKLYIVVRSDLTPGARCAQACHTLRAFVAAHPDVDRAWFEGSNNLVVLEAPDEPALAELERRAARAGVPTATFREPDFGDELTGVALGPAGARLVSSLPLALRPRTPIQRRDAPTPRRSVLAALRSAIGL